LRIQVSNIVEALLTWVYGFEDIILPVPSLKNNERNRLVVFPSLTIKKLNHYSNKMFQYEIQKTLSEDVFLAKAGDNYFVLKCRSQEDFEREKDVMDTLKDVPGIEHPVDSFGKKDKKKGGCLVYPKIKGKTLDKIFPRLSKERKELLSLQLACTLKRIHKEGIVQNDVRQENIIVSGDQIYIVDFGNSFFSLEKEDSKYVPLYIPPEGVARPSFHTDLWGLGIVLFSLWSKESVPTHTGYSLDDPFFPNPYIDPEMIPDHLDRTSPDVIVKLIQNLLSHEPEKREISIG
jgi:serine/threonine protein kinase